MSRMILGLALMTVLAVGGVSARADAPDAASESVLRAQGAAGARRHVREVPRREEGQRRPAARLARGDAHRRRERPGGRAGRPGGQPAGPGDPPRRRDAQDAARQAAAPRRPGRPGRLGRRRRALAEGRPRRRPIEGQAHWAFEPLRTITPPEDPTGWAAQPIDRLIAAGHRAEGLHPVARADRRTLDPPGVLRPDRPAARARAGRGVRRRRPARRLRAAGRRAARLAPLRRALGPLLARPRPLRRHGRRQLRLSDPARPTSTATT